MTLVLASYISTDGLHADIMQDKYCSSFKLDIYKPYHTEKATVLSIYRGTYYTKKTARQAMNRFSKTWTKVK